MGQLSDLSTQKREIRIHNCSNGLVKDWDDACEKYGQKTSAETLSIILDKARKHDQTLSWAERFNMSMEEVDDLIGINSVIKRGESLEAPAPVKALAAIFKFLKREGKI